MSRVLSDVKAVFADVLQRGLDLDDMLYESPSGRRPLPSSARG
jgi:hypothetical protein